MRQAIHMISERIEYLKTLKQTKFVSGQIYECELLLLRFETLLKIHKKL